MHKLLQCCIVLLHMACAFGAIFRRPSNVQIHGHVEPGFESVKELFTQNFYSGLEENAQCCIYVDGEKVVDLWGSVESIPAASAPAYTADTLQNIFSSTKSLTSIAIASLVDRGLAEYDEPISKHWPEFGQNGKAGVTLADVLRHESGLAWFNHTFELADLLPVSIEANVVGTVIENEILRYPPPESGTTREYHAITRGWILNEVFRRLDPAGRTIGEYLRTDVSAPLQADVYVGLRESELMRSHNLTKWSDPYLIAQVLLAPPSEPRTAFLKFTMDALTAKLKKLWSFGSDPDENSSATGDSDVPGNQLKMMRILMEEGMIGGFNHPMMKYGEHGSTNGQCSARGLALVAAAMANQGQLNNVQLMSKATWTAMHDKVVSRYDNMISPMSGANTSFSQGGIAAFKVLHDDPSSPALPELVLRDGFWGWHGYGGSVFQWHPELKIGFGYTPTWLATYDIENIKGAKLQKEAVNCVKNLRSENHAAQAAQDLSILEFISEDRLRGFAPAASGAWNLMKSTMWGAWNLMKST